MTFLYARVGSASAAGLLGETDAGWLCGASARGLPHRRAWIASACRIGAGALGDLWRDLACAAPRRVTPPQQGQQSYILQQDPNGLWFVDPWGERAGTIRPASAPVVRATAATSANTCFIIELRHAT